MIWKKIAKNLQINNLFNSCTWCKASCCWESRCTLTSTSTVKHRIESNSADLKTSSLSAKNAKNVSDQKKLEKQNFKQNENVKVRKT